MELNGKEIRLTEVKEHLTQALIEGQRKAFRRGYAAGLCIVLCGALTSSAIKHNIYISIIAFLIVLPIAILSFILGSRPSKRSEARIRQRVMQLPLATASASYRAVATKEAIKEVLHSEIAPLDTPLPCAPFSDAAELAVLVHFGSKSYFFGFSYALLLISCSPLPQEETAIHIATFSFKTPVTKRNAQKALDKCVAALSGQFGQP